ncbi:hypothetical protein [Agathobaculum desmolans]|uniref:hypothetical protein n=1 Tax=Agathobaculum desmolans TaxID=39484 RepID=UPI0012B66EB0|nr:hypothetical protein [Agathobaculum desmolans]
MRKSSCEPALPSARAAEPVLSRRCVWSRSGRAYVCRYVWSHNGGLTENGMLT